MTVPSRPRSLGARLFALALAVLLALPLVGCSSGGQAQPAGEPAEQPVEEPAEQPVEESVEESAEDAPAAPYGGASDEEILAVANERVGSLFNGALGMFSGTFVDCSWDEYVTIDGMPCYPVTGAGSLAEVEDLWYASFSHRYSVEEVTGMEIPYFEMDGTLYVQVRGIGFEGAEFSLDSVVRLSADEVLVSGTYAMDYGGTYTLSLTLVWEDGAWKCGRFLEAPLCAESQGTKVVPDAGSWTTEDYLAYVEERLVASGDLYEGALLGVESETADALQVVVYEDSPAKITVTGRFLLDKGDLTILDMTFNTYL